MYRFFARPICLGLIAFGCGSPGDLDRSRFPELADTGYPDRVGAAGAAGGGTFGGSGGGAVGGSGSLGGSGGAGGSLGGSGTGGQSGSSGQSGSAGQPSTGQGGTGSQPGCPDDILLLLNRPSTEGGCAGGGCHIPAGTTPDLTSPGVEARLLNVMSTCNGRPYIAADDSFLEEKLTASDPDCGGVQMPFFAVANLSAEDRACILEWIDEVAAGM